MDKIIRPTVVLLVICLVISAALAFTYAITKDQIAVSDAAAANAARVEVMVPGAQFFAVTLPNSGDNVEYPYISELYEAKSSDGQLLGYVATVINTGYGGEITSIIGITPELKVTGFRLTKHGETPGLGANAAMPDFHNQFSEKDASSGINYVKGATEDSAAANEIAAISGATITTNAVTEAVNLLVSAVTAMQ